MLYSYPAYLLSGYGGGYGGIVAALWRHLVRRRLDSSVTSD